MAAVIDILIVGAGPSGLCAAKTILQYDKHAQPVLLDASPSLGGAWSRERLYPTLRTNNLKGTMDFTDFDMQDDRFAVRSGEHVPGEAMNTYLRAYADHFGLTERIRFGCRVVEAQHLENNQGWRITAKRSACDLEVLQCKRLIIATGVLNLPYMPDLEGSESFQGPIIHSSALGVNSEAIFANNSDIDTIAVLGGGKSAYDAVYLAATRGRRVEWIIRKSGRGPTWVFPPHTYLGPFRAWREKLITRRLVSFMSPWVWPDFSGLSWLRKLLHSNRIGRFISRTFWSLIHTDTIRDCGYRTDEILNVLEPEQSPFWFGTGTGTLGYDQDFFSYIRSGQVKIHREDISQLSPRTVHLVNGLSLPADAVVACTGFSSQPDINFTPSSLHPGLGIPTTTGLDREREALWAELDQKADLAIGSKFPQLLSGPHLRNSSLSAGATSTTQSGQGTTSPLTPWRLYRGVAPPGLTAASDRSLVFIGMFSNVANTIRLEVQCLWALAYLERKLPSLDADGRADEGAGQQDKVLEDTALLQRFCQHRAPCGHGAFYPDLNFDQLPYWDVLLHDLGLPTARKGGFWRELLEPYGQSDYRGIVQEWIESVS